jgi:hypothetical protein
MSDILITKSSGSLRRGTLVEVLSTDAHISGDEGWWTGRVGNKVGIFPSNFVTIDINTSVAKRLHSNNQPYYTQNNHRNWCCFVVFCHFGAELTRKISHMI